MVKVAKKLFTLSVVTLTILWSVGIAALVPAVALAEECPTLKAGDLWKVPTVSAVYVLNADMESLYFPNAEVYKTWFADYSAVQTIPSTCVSLYPTPKTFPVGVNYRPGSMLVKRQITNDVYAVEPGNKMAKIGSEAVASALYGATWTKLVRDINDAFWPNLTGTGAELSTAVAHDGMLVKTSATGKVYQVEAGKAYEVVGDLGLTAKDVHVVAASALPEVAGTTVTSASVVEDATQLGMTPSTPGTDTPVTGGNLNVSLSAETPNAGNVVINVDNVVFGKFNFKAGSKDVVVNSVKIGRAGLGATGDFTSVTLYDGATKLGTTKTSWNNDQTMTYNISGGWTIAAGTTKTLTVTAKLGTASKYNSLGLTTVTTNGGTVAGLPVYGNQMVGVNVSVGTVTITDAGTVQNKKIGTQGVTLASFKLAIDAIENGKFEAITLKNKGTAADGDVDNMSLYAGATKLAGPVSMVNDKITFTIDESRLIEKSKNETFKVVGDVVDGVGNNVEFILDTTTDLKVMGQVYNTYMTVTNGAYNAIGEGATTTIDGAELNLSYTGTNLDVVADTEDVNFGTLTLSAGATDIKITNLAMFMDETDASAGADVLDVQNLELIDQVGGASYSGATTSDLGVSAADVQWAFTDEIYLTAGESRKFTIQGDLPASIANGDSYKVGMTVTTANLTAETVPAGDSVSNFSIGSFTGKTITVKSPTLKVTGITQNAGTAVVNDADVSLFKGILEASADDIHVTYADFEAYSIFQTNNWTQVGFYTSPSTNGPWTQQQLITNSGMTSGTMAFDSLDFTVKNGTANKVYFLVKGTVGATLPGTGSGATSTLKLDYFTVKDSANDDALLVDSAGSNLATLGATYLTVGARTVTLYDKGKLSIQLRNNDAGYNKDRIVLAGAEIWLAKLQLRADDEDVKIKDLKFTNTLSTADESVEQVCLYKAAVKSDENLVGCASMDTSGVVFFDDIDEVVAQGTVTWYVYVKVAAMNNLEGGTADAGDQIQLAITTTTANSVVVEGVRSGYAYTYGGHDGSTQAAGEYAFDYDVDNSYNEAVDAKTASSTSFYVYGNRISSVTLANGVGCDTNGNNCVVSKDTSLSGHGTYIAAILAVTAEASNNTDSSGNPLKVALDAVRFDVDKYASTTLSAVTIERYGGTDGAKGMVLSGLNDVDTTTGIDGTAVTSTMADIFTNDHLIDSGTTAYYVVKATVNGTNDTDNKIDWFQFNMDDLSGTFNTDADNNLDWKDRSGGTTVNALLLNDTYLTGAKVTE